MRTIDISANGASALSPFGTNSFQRILDASSVTAVVDKPSVRALAE
jgi:hypothetical protein